MRDMEIDDTRLNDCKTVLNVDRKDAIHSLKLNKNSAFGGKCSAAQSRAGAARQKRDSVFTRDADDLSHLVGCCRKYDNVRFFLEERKAIALVNEQLVFVIHHRGRLQNRSQFGQYFLPHGFACCSLSFLICSLTNAACG